MDDFWGTLFRFENYGELLVLVQNSIYAGALLAVVGGLIGVFIMQRDMQFAVHGISELSFAGASAALLFGINVVLGSLIGSLIAALIIGVLGVRAKDRNSIVAVLMPFGLGLGILFLALVSGAERQQIRPLDRSDCVRRQRTARSANHHLSDCRSRSHRPLAPTELRERRCGCRASARPSRRRNLDRFHDPARARGGRSHSDHRCSFGARVAGHPGGGGHEGDRVSVPHSPAERFVRNGVDGRRHFVVYCWGAAD